MIKGLSRTILAGIIIAIIAIGIATYLFVTTMGIGQPGGKPMLVYMGEGYICTSTTILGRAKG
jgi:hypothetical protein